MTVLAEIHPTHICLANLFEALLQDDIVLLGLNSILLSCKHLINNERSFQSLFISIRHCFVFNGLFTLHGIQERNWRNSK